MLYGYVRFSPAENFRENLSGERIQRLGFPHRDVDQLAHRLEVHQGRVKCGLQIPGLADSTVFKECFNLFETILTEPVVEPPQDCQGRLAEPQ